MKIYLFILLLILSNNYSFGQALACKGTLNVALGPGGTASVTPGDVLVAPSQNSTYTLSQSVFNCSDISLSPIRVTVTEFPSNNSCQLNVNVEDKRNSCDADGDGCLDINDANPLIASGDSDTDGIADDCDPIFNIANLVTNTVIYIINLNLNNGNKIALTVKLYSALDKYCIGKATPAINDLKAFKNQVNAFKIANKISSSKVAYLNAAADATVAAIGNGNIQCPGQNRIISGINGNYTLDLEIDFGLEVYPNPARDIVTIRFGASEDKTKVVIYDIYGKQVWTQTTEQYQDILNVDLSTGQFRTGMYIISVSNENGTQTQRMLVNK